MDSIQMPESIRRIVSSEDRQLAWAFFVFFSRFEYALKRTPDYLQAGQENAQPNWDKFASKHKSLFNPKLNDELFKAVTYFEKSPPKKQIIDNGHLDWSTPQLRDRREPQLIWLLRMVRCVRNNLFHGGKFPVVGSYDSSRDRDLLFNSIIILNACLLLNDNVSHSFHEEFDNQFTT